MEITEKSKPDYWLGKSVKLMIRKETFGKTQMNQNNQNS